MKHIQSIREGRVQNKHPFGSALHRFLRSNDVFSLIYRHGCGWTDGGCVTLSFAFKQWLGDDAEVCCIYKRPGYEQHVIVRLFGEDLFLDGDGMGTSDDLLEKMRELEGLTGEFYIGPFNFEKIPEGMELFRETADDIAALLRKKFEYFKEDCMTYDVTVQRTSFDEATFKVEAKSKREAETKAIAMAGDHEFGSGNAEYEVQSVEKTS